MEFVIHWMDNLKPLGRRSLFYFLSFCLNLFLYEFQHIRIRELLRTEDGKECRGSSIRLRQQERGGLRKVVPDSQ
jgi:hypothetical protein